MKRIKQLNVFLLVSLLAIGLVSCTKSNLAPKNQAPSLQVTVSTLAGNTAKGNKDGTGTAATFYNPYSVAVDSHGNLFVADVDNYLIRKITPAGVVSTFAGTGNAGSVNGTGTAASFGLPLGIVIDGSDNLYVADATNKLIRKITPAGVVSTFAGSGTNAITDGAGTAASFKVPGYMAIDATGNLFVTDYSYIRKITPAGVVSTIAGNGGQGSAIRTETAADFNGATGIAVDAADNLYVTDYNYNLIRKITPAGAVSTIAGNGTKGSIDGTGITASFDNPLGIAIDTQGNLFVGEADYRLRMVTPAGVVTTIAGNGTYGSLDGPGTMATFSGFSGITVSGNALYIADTGNNSIRKVSF